MKPQPQPPQLVKCFSRVLVRPIGPQGEPSWRGYDLSQIPDAVADYAAELARWEALQAAPLPDDYLIGAVR